MSNPPLVLDAHEKGARAVHFTRDGKHLVSAGQDGVKLWSVPRFQAPQALTAAPVGVQALAFSADERRLAVSGADGVSVLAFPDGTLERRLEKQALGVLGPDGQHLATLSHLGEARAQLALWDGDTGALLRTVPALDKRPTTLAFAGTGLFLFVGGTGPIHRLCVPDATVDGVQAGHQIGVTCLVPSPNPAILGSTGLDGTLRFWAVVGGAEVNTVQLEAPGALQLAFAPDGRSVAVSIDHAVLWLSAPDGVPKRRFELPVKGVHGVSFSPDGRRLACAASDGRVRVWELSR